MITSRIILELDQSNSKVILKALARILTPLNETSEKDIKNILVEHRKMLGIKKNDIYESISPDHLRTIHAYAVAIDRVIEMEPDVLSKHLKKANKGKGDDFGSNFLRELKCPEEDIKLLHELSLIDRVVNVSEKIIEARDNINKLNKWIYSLSDSSISNYDISNYAILEELAKCSGNFQADALDLDRFRELLDESGLGDIDFNSISDDQIKDLYDNQVRVQYIVAKAGKYIDDNLTVPTIELRLATPPNTDNEFKRKLRLYHSTILNIQTVSPNVTEATIYNVIHQLPHNKISMLTSQAKEVAYDEIHKIIKAEIKNLDPDDPALLAIADAIKSQSPESIQEFKAIRAILITHKRSLGRLADFDNTLIENAFNFPKIMDDRSKEKNEKSKIIISGIYNQTITKVSAHLTEIAIDNIKTKEIKNEVLSDLEDLENFNPPVSKPHKVKSLLGDDTDSSDDESFVIPILRSDADKENPLFIHRNLLGINHFSENIIQKLTPNDASIIANEATEQIRANQLAKDITDEITKRSATNDLLLSNFAETDLANLVSLTNNLDLLSQDFGINNADTLSERHVLELQKYAQAQILCNKISENIFSKNDQNDPVLNSLDKVSSFKEHLDKLYIFRNKLGINDATESDINALTEKQALRLHHETRGQIVKNQIVSMIQQGDLAENDTKKLAEELKDEDDKIIIKYLKFITKLEVEALSNSQINILLREAKKQNAVNSFNNLINSMGKTTGEQDRRVLYYLGSPTPKDAMEIKQRINTAAIQFDLDITRDIIQKLSEEQAARIYKTAKIKLKELEPYSKLIIGLPNDSPLTLLLKDEDNMAEAQTLRAYCNTNRTFVDKLLNTTKTKAEIKTELQSIPMVFKSPQDDMMVDELSKFIFAENQYRRIQEDTHVPSHIRESIKNAREEGQGDPILDKIIQASTPQQVDKLITDIQTAANFQDLKDAIDSLGLDDDAAGDLFGHKEYERLLKKHEHNTFLAPLLKANKNSIVDVIAGNAESGMRTTSASVDALFDFMLQTSNKTNIIPNLAVLGITHRPNPSGAGSVPLENSLHDQQIYFGKLAYQHLHDNAGPDLATKLHSANIVGNGFAVERSLGELNDLDKINKLKLQSKENLANYIENDLGLSQVRIPPAAGAGPGAEAQPFTIADPDAKQIFAEIQYQTMVDEAAKKRPGSILHAQLKDHANKTKIINQIRNSDEINTSRDIVTLYNRLNDAETDVDLRNAARDLGFTYPDLNAAVKANKDNRFDKTSTATMSTMDFQRIKNNLNSYKKWLDHYLKQTMYAQAEESNRRTIEQIKNAAFELKLQLTAFKNECIKKQTDGDPEMANYINIHFNNDDIVNRRLGLNKYLDDGGIIDQIRKNTDDILKELSPELIAYYQPSGNKAKAEPVDSYEDALKGMTKLFGKDVHKHDVAGSIGTGSSLKRHGIHTQETVSWIPMDIKIPGDGTSPPEYIRAAVVRRKEADNTKNARLDFFFKSKEDMAKLVNVKRESDSLLNLNSIPGMPIMEWAAAHIKTLRSMCDDKLAPIFLDDQGMAKDLKESIQLYCNYKGYDCRPPGSFNDTQIETFKKRWVDGTADKPPIQIDDLGIREIMKLKADTTLKPAKVVPPQETPPRFHS